jgi:hypothetical protein
MKFRVATRLSLAMWRGPDLAGKPGVKRPQLRMPPRLGTVAVAAILFAFLASAVRAQSSTADGVAALLRGNYETAVRIFRPLADEAGPHPDPLAQYFLGMLYDTGQGVAGNQFLACELYLRAVKPENPFMAQSSAAAEFIRTSLGPLGARACSSDPAERWGTPPYASFSLGPGHSLVIDETGATITYEGAQFHAVMKLGGPGFVGLPIRYTPVDVSRPAQARRHFIQLFSWSPTRPFDQSEWGLSWYVGEVVGPNLVPVMNETKLVIVAASLPPTSFDADSAAAVSVNANGEAEWIIREGPNPRSGIVPSNLSVPPRVPR